MPCDRLKSRERGYFRRSVYPDAERGPGAPCLVDRQGAHRPELDQGSDGHRLRLLPFTYKHLATVGHSLCWELGVRGVATHRHLDYSRCPVREF